MIEIDRHIEILLLSNDCVIVPGLGGFMTHHVEARYDADDQMFLPPLRTLGFNPQLTMNDSLLVQSYIEAYDISYPEALRRIESEVEELKQHIDVAGSYELNDIGELSLNEEGRYLFTPCEAGILTPGLYGLSGFEMKPVEIALPIAEVKDEKVVEETVAPVLGGLTPDNDEDDERALVIKMSWIRNTVAIAAAVLAFFLLTTPVSNSSSTQMNMGQLNNPLLVTQKPAAKTDTTLKLAPDTTVADKAVAEVTETKQDSVVAKPEAQPEANPEVQKPKAQPADKTGYYLVLASHVSMKNATAFVDELHKRGFSEAEIFVRNNVTRVVCGHFETMNAAYNRLNRVRDNKGFEEAWVLKLKDKV